MESMNSFKGYGKVDPADDQAFRRKTRKRIVICTISAVVLAALIIGVVAGTVAHKRRNKSPPETAVPTDLTPAASLRAVCSVTQYPSSCLSSISEIDSANNTDPEVYFKLSLKVAVNEIGRFRDYASRVVESVKDANLKAALSVCESVIDDAFDRLNDSVSVMEVGEVKKILSTSKINDLKTWLSTSITDQETCLDALQELNGTDHFDSKVFDGIRLAMENSTEFASNSLAIVTKIVGLFSDFNIPIHRKLLGFEGGKSGFPGWVSLGDRRLLQEAKPTPNVTVAKDGSGDVLTIEEAVVKIPKKGLTRFIIYVKEGTYTENILLDKHKWNVMIYGDGMDKTVIAGSKNFVDGTPTFSTATFAVAGKGFMAKDIKFINTAGAAKHQAVAFRSGSDMSVYYQCSFDAYQDTLYAHSNRQFYRDCSITGTIDFIFGNAAVIFQNCQIMPRQPLPNQFNTITAQGKKDPNQNTGISIQKCEFTPLNANLTAPTYLGRPWKDFSTTVIMQSIIGSFLDPTGWKSWVSGVDPPSSILYGEYQNTGPGSAVDKRVSWAGYKPSLTADEAAKFTVGSFIQGTEWLPAVSVAFDSTL